MEDPIDVGIAITAIRQNSPKQLHVPINPQLARRLFVAKAAVEIGAQGSMSGIAGKLAEMVDVIGERGQGYDIALSLSADPVGVEHPGVEGDANDTVAP